MFYGGDTYQILKGIVVQIRREKQTQS
jgi:hypothetical protein